jgi:iron(III) transport system ATP-binding protein
MGHIVKIRNLSKSFQTGELTVQAVQNVSLDVEEGSFLSLLGPSGCGKTTTLRCLAGLEVPEQGEIIIDNDPVVSANRRLFTPPHKRDIGMVFQSYAIWPHMNVFNNVAFPLTQMKPRLTRRRIREKVLRALEQVRLGGLEERPAPQLSGGQQQRLALARALVKEPKVLLLDEPLSNLDAKLREEMRVELKELTRRLGITSIYVTHDQLEALSLSDIVAVMYNGKVVQIGSPKDIYVSPASKFVAGFIGTSNLLEGIVEESGVDGATCKIRTGLGIFDSAVPSGVKKGDKSVILGRPEDFELLQKKPPIFQNVVEGEVKVLLYLGDSIDCRVLVNDQLLQLKLQPNVQTCLGEKVFVRLAPEACRVLVLNEEAAE